MNELNLNDIKHHGLKIYEAIFNKKKIVIIDDSEYDIQQNHNKKSEWAKKARQGHQIMWVLKGRRYLARIMDGDFINLKKDKE